MMIDVNFTSANAQSQSEQLRILLSRAFRLRYLRLRRPPLNPLNCTPRLDPSRCKTEAHPFPLRSSHFRSSNLYLSNLTHLELRGLSVHPFLLSHFPQLTHLKLSLAEQYDGYPAVEALNVIAAIRGCNLVAFEIGLHVTTSEHERLDVLRACVAAWPNISTLYLFSLDQDGYVATLSDHPPRLEVSCFTLIPEIYLYLY